MKNTASIIITTIVFMSAIQLAIVGFATVTDINPLFLSTVFYGGYVFYKVVNYLEKQDAE